MGTRAGWPALVFAAAAAVGAAACGSDGGRAVPPRATGRPADRPAGSATGPGISVEEARDATGPGPLLVKGFIVAYPGEAVRLCGELTASRPPRCTGASLVVEGLDLGSLPGLDSADGAGGGQARWSPRPVQLLGDVAGGVLTVAPNARA